MFGQVDPTVLLILFVAIFSFSILLLLIKRYKRCPSNKILVIYGKVGGAAGGEVPPRRRRVRLAADPGLRLSSTSSRSRSRSRCKGALSIENIRVNVPVASSPSRSAPSPR